MPGVLPSATAAPDPEPMRPAPGDIVYAYRKTKPPSRRLFSIRLGLQHPVLRLNPLSVTDEHGNDWIEVLPVPHGVLDTLDTGKPPWPTLREALGRGGGASTPAR